MKGLEGKTAAGIYIEIGQTSLKVLDGEDGAEFRLERLETGKLTPDCKKRVTGELQTFLNRKGGPGLRPAYCAIGARGVSLRPMSLPAATREEFQRVLLLQIESEFPLPPGELAWGHLKSGAKETGSNGANQDVIVVAVKKDVLEEYTELLAGCGLSPVFTLSALARNSICPPQAGPYAVLEIGRKQSELIAFDQGSPKSVRTLAWGGDNLTAAIADRLQVSLADAEKLKLNFDQKTAWNGGSGEAVGGAIDQELNTLATAVKTAWKGDKLYLAGRTARQKDLAAQLGLRLGIGVNCERLETAPGEGRSTAIMGLKRAVELDRSRPMLVFQTPESKGATSIARQIPWRLVRSAAALLLIWICFPFIEAVAMKPRLEKKIAQIRANKETLATIDREYEFLEFLKRNQPPYLEAIYKLAASASPGMRIDSLSLDRRGDVALKGTIQGSQGVTDFRSKLVDSGLFYNVVLEEQTPAQDRQKMTVRFTAQWKPGIDRDSLPKDVGPVEDKSKSGASSTPLPVMDVPMPMPVPAPPVAESVVAPPKMDVVPADTSTNQPAARGRRGGRRGAPAEGTGDGG